MVVNRALNPASSVKRACIGQHEIKIALFTFLMHVLGFMNYSSVHVILRKNNNIFVTVHQNIITCSTSRMIFLLS